MIIAAIAAALVSCEKNGTEDEIREPEVVKTDSIFYSGTLLANASSGDCETPGTKVSINLTDKADSVSITIFKAKLAQRMPAMDIVIPGISLQKNGDVTVITSERSVPLAMGVEYTNYTVTGFHGEAVGRELTFSLNFAQTPTSFSGTLITE